MESDKSLTGVVRRVLLVQTMYAVLCVSVVLIYHVVFSQAEHALLISSIKASLFGGGLAIVGTVLAGRSIGRIRCFASNGVMKVSIGSAFIGLLNRFVVVGGGIGFALVALHLPPVYLILSFLVVQIAQIGANRRRG